MNDGRLHTVLVVVVAIGMLLTTAVGGVAASEHEGYVVEQGDQCVPVAPITGEENATEFYDYQPDENFSSMGTKAYQEDDTSTLMLYEGSDGLSLVIVHEKWYESSSDGTNGSSVSFEVTNLPEDGEWTVEDDDYDGQTDYFQRNGTESELHWTYARARTDGAVYTGLGNDFQVQIDARWNEDAELWDEFGLKYNGAVDDWQVVTATEDDGFERHSLNEMNDSVTISDGSCEPSVSDYTNEDGVVDTDGLRDAVDDWRDGEVSTDLLQEVVDYWRSGDNVV